MTGTTKNPVKTTDSRVGKWAKYQTYGPPKGKCNLCGTFAALTEDHIPPKGGPRVSQVEMRSLIEKLATEVQIGGGPARRSQNGVKFRTLCKACNNGIIGRYDREYCDLANRVNGLLQSALLIPAHQRIACRPQRLTRSVVGHLLAFGVERPPAGEMPIALSEYVRDETLPLPPEAEIFYWLYPYRDQIVIRDCGYLEIQKGMTEPFVFNLLKAYPFAFFLTWKKPAALGFRVNDLNAARHLGIDDPMEIDLQLTGLPPQRWPEAATDSSILLYGGSPLHARRIGGLE